MKSLTPLLTLASALALTACNQDTADSQSAAKSAPPAAPALSANVVPDDLFLAEAPANAVPISQARANAKTGDTIAFTGYVGGRVQPFTQGRAIFLVADPEKAPACTDDHCETPWDACCVPGDEIAANSATVQVLAADGKTLRLDLNGQNSLAPGSPVTIVGKVREASEQVFLVDASGIALTPQNQ